MASSVHLLDVGTLPYGDAVLCEFGSKTVLIDGAHPGDDQPDGDYAGIAQQVQDILGHAPPFVVDLLVVSHAHLDHIGCLPALVGAGQLKARFALVSDPDLGWARPADDAGDAPVPAIDPMVAALREESLPGGVADSAAEQWLSDAANLETRYRSMLDRLAHDGTKVFRLGQAAANLPDLEKAFASIGLRVLGPSVNQLVRCAELIGASTIQLNQAVHPNDGLGSDQPVSVPDYRRVLESLSSDALADAAAAKSRLGAAINLQSSVLTFTVEGKRYLFAGDMQFVRPQVSGLDKELATLKSLVAASAPYAFAKLSHHGSDNSVDTAWLDSLGATPIVGICAGSGSTAHPNPTVLRLLKDRKGHPHWVRTDHNGLSTITVKSSGSPKFEVTRGNSDDPQPNSTDAEVAPTSTASASVAVPPTTQAPKATVELTGSTAGTGSVTSGDVVTLNATIPTSVRRVRFTVEIDDAAEESAHEAPETVTPSSTGSRPSVAPASPAPRKEDMSDPFLLFVTAPDGLRANVGSAEGDRVMDALGHRRGAVVELERNLAIDQVIARVSGAITPSVDGVVLVGGYDVVPAQRVDTLPADLRASLTPGQDADNFIVWSDDVFGDRDGDGLAELPVSRIPDGLSSELLLGALSSSGAAAPAGSRGLRNVMRPFADGIYAALDERSMMLVSEPVTFKSPELDVSGQNVYLMLHGDYTDGSRFWGEGAPGNLEAMNAASIRPMNGGVVVSGACWGALVVETPASRYLTGRPFGPRTPNGSIALTYLANGARAFIGCTGSHYSPLAEPFDFFGGPLHALIWQAIDAGVAPARALFEAKAAYVSAIPHGRATRSATAIELKLWREFTCLGLGW